MKGLQLKVLCLGLISTMLFSSGCASAKKAKRIEELQGQVVQLTQTLEERDEQLQALQKTMEEMKSSYQSSLGGLQSELEKYKMQQESSEEPAKLK